jgi:aspartate--ammonia ligase
MGIRVDKNALLKQLKVNDCEERASFLFHNMLLSGELPESIGGGIGQSRVCMFMLKKKHIGEVQVSIWSSEEREKMNLKGVNLL